MTYEHSLVKRITSCWIKGSEKGPRREVWFSWREEEGSLHLNGRSNYIGGGKIAAVKNFRESPKIIYNSEIFGTGDPVYSTRAGIMLETLFEEAAIEGYSITSLPFSILDSVEMNPRILRVLGEKKVLTLVGQDRRKMLLGRVFGSLVSLRCGSIEDALNFLKPLEIIDAEASGRKIVRQGDWFFAHFPEHQDILMDRWNNVQLYGGSRIRGYRLPHGKENVHVAHKGCEVGGKIYVTGTLRHHKHQKDYERCPPLGMASGKHRMIELNGPWLAVRNRSKGNFSN